VFEININDPSGNNNALGTEQAFLLRKPKNTVKEKQIQEEPVVSVHTYNFGKPQLLCP